MHAFLNTFYQAFFYGCLKSKGIQANIFLWIPHVVGG